MSLQNPIADMIIRITNAQLIKQSIVYIGLSKIKLAIINILYEQGYIHNYYLIINPIKLIKIKLKYFNHKPVIETIKQISKPSKRIYKPIKNIKSIMNGLGTIIISTSKGVMTDKQARKLNLGGEILCYVI